MPDNKIDCKKKGEGHSRKSTLLFLIGSVDDDCQRYDHEVR
jgi:hypothetical protein